MSKGWRREDPDCNPDSVGCPRDLSWLPDSARWGSWLWEFESWSKPGRGFDPRTHEEQEGHYLLSVNLRAPSRPTDADFSCSFVPLYPGFLPERFSVKYPDSLPAAMHEQFVTHHLPGVLAACPRTRLGALHGLCGYYGGSNAGWREYLSKDIRGVSAVLDRRYKAFKKWEKAERDRKHRELAEKIL